MKSIALALVLALAGEVRAQMPYHPRPEDASVRYGDSDAFKKINPVTGDYNTQTERFLRIQGRFAVAAPAVYLVATRLRSCRSALRTARSLIARTFGDFSARKSIDPLDHGKDWPFGPQYDVGTPLAVLQSFRHCVLARPHDNAAAGIPDDVLRILDVSIVDDELVPGNPNLVPVTPLAPPCLESDVCAGGAKACTSDGDCRRDRRRLALGMLTGKPIARPPLTEDQVAKIHEIHQCHHDFGESVKNGTPPPACNTIALHHEVEAMARDAEERTLLTMPEFPTAVDRARPAQQIADLFDLADEAHMEWMAAVLALDQTRAWRAGLAHQRAHIFLTVYWPPDFKLRTICDTTDITHCPSKGFPPR